MSSNIERRAASILVIAVMVSAGCSITSKNPEFCCSSAADCAAAGVDEDRRDCESGFVCHADVHTCIPEGCGNGMLDPGEQCDDGNNDDGDGCSEKCDVARCLVPVTHSTIQGALNDAGCDPVFVAAGTYNENVTIAGNRTVRGVGAEAAVIDGQAKGTVVTIASGVVALEHLTVRNGHAEAGGGIVNHGSLTLRDTRVEANTATSTTPKGGGVFSDGLSLQLESSTVAGNHVIVDGAGALPSGAGGGIYKAAGSLNLAGGSVEGNDIKATRAIDGVIAIGAGIASESGDVTLDGATIKLNSISLDGHPGRATGRGAGLYAIAGTLRLTKANIAGNAMTVAGFTAEGTGGGALATTVEAVDSLLENNRVHVLYESSCDACDVKGGGLLINGPLRSTLSSTTVTGNQVELSVSSAFTTAFGAGVTVEGLGSLSVTGSAVTGNMLTASGTDVSAMGAGIAWRPSALGGGGELSIVTSTIASNTTTAYYAFGGGVGVLALSGGHHVFVRQSTVNGNRVDGYDAVFGSGLWISGENTMGKNTVDVVSSTLSGNDAQFRNGLGLTGGIEADASVTGGVSVGIASSTIHSLGPNLVGVHIRSPKVTATTKNSIIFNCAGPITSWSNNYFANLSGCTVTTTALDLVGRALDLGELADNGGPTRTHAVLAGSSTIDAGALAGCADEADVLLTQDQRGKPRLVNGRCDIGAFEK